MGLKGCKYHVHFTSRALRDRLIFWKINQAWLISAALNIVFELDLQENKIVLREFQYIFTSYVIDGKIFWKWSEGKQKLLRVSGRFKLPRGCMKEIQGKSILVWVSATSSYRGFELSGVDCIITTVIVMITVIVPFALSLLAMANTMVTRYYVTSSRWWSHF